MYCKVTLVIIACVVNQYDSKTIMATSASSRFFNMSLDGGSLMISDLAV